MTDRLYRSRSDRMIGGIAGGMAAALRIDPSIVRIAWVLLAIVTSGAAILVYFAGLFIIPEEPEGPTAPVTDETATADAGTASRAAFAEDDRRPGPTTPPPAGAPRAGIGDPALLVGLLLILVGAWFLLRQVVPQLDLRVSWPFVAIGLGVVLVVLALGRGRSRNR